MYNKKIESYEFLISSTICGIKQKNEYLSKLLDSIFDDEKLLRRFIISPGSYEHHHAYMYGLITHVEGMFNILNAIGSFKSDTIHIGDGINIYNLGEPSTKLSFEYWDMMGYILLHDLGKIELYGLNSDLIPIYLRKKGDNIDHILIGLNMIKPKIEQINGFPSELSDKIINIIKAHHGKLEWGSHKVPETPDEWILHNIDMLDSQSQPDNFR